MHANPLFMGGVVTSLIGNLLTLPLELFLLSASFIGLLVSAVFTFLGTSIISLFAIVASLTLFSFIFGGLIMTTVAAFGTIATMAAFFGTAAFTGMFVMGVLRAFAQPFLSANQQRFPAPTLPRFTRQRQSEMRRVPIGRQQQQQQQGVSRERQEAIERIEDDVSSRADLDDWDARMKKKVIDDLKL
ncbi:unnamed protein product [Vitrella brassicaformis CCMP3155]|uniref:Uncharacterized protein n=2 Tax=Vitrella brassicaformis TaxID=1169539 RepID=A0A0G4EQ91_VITBC|nr:unnamed protein product [Vitrella brassicaformis CCMP3155]|eukprot:CEL99457.1 unnamed protein product [Vitrella brassicaformis CCMP3155]